MEYVTDWRNTSDRDMHERAAIQEREQKETRWSGQEAELDELGCVYRHLVLGKKGSDTSSNAAEKGILLFVCCRIVLIARRKGLSVREEEKQCSVYEPISRRIRTSSTVTN